MQAVERASNSLQPATGTRTFLPPRPRVVILITIAVRLVTLFAIHIHSHLVGEGGFNAFPYGGLDDGRYYYTTGQQLADGIEPPYVLNAFPRAIAILMDLGIRDLLALKLISFAISSISVLLFGLLVLHLTQGMAVSVRRWSVAVVCVIGSLFPSSVFWSVNSLMRDGLILSFAVIAIWAVSGAAAKPIPKLRWGVAVAAIAAATSFRPYFLPVFVAAYAGANFTLANPLRRVQQRPISVALRLSIISFGFIWLCIAAAPVIADISGFNILAWRTQEQLSGKGSSMHLEFEGVDASIVVFRYFISLVSNAIGPLPNQIRTPNQMLNFVEFPFFLAIGYGLTKANYSHRLARFCGLFGLYWLLLLGLWNDVLGNGARNRVLAWPVLAVVAAPALGRILADRFSEPTQLAIAPELIGVSRAERSARRRSLPARRSDADGLSLVDTKKLGPATAADLVRTDGLDTSEFIGRSSRNDRRQNERRQADRRSAASSIEPRASLFSPRPPAGRRHSDHRLPDASGEGPT